MKPWPRWGLLGLGAIANDFSIGLMLAGSNIAAVAARDAARADVFAKKVGAARAYGSYEELVQDPNVDVVYVGTVNTQHLCHSKLALGTGKHVVCEKPIGVNEAQVRELVDLARKNGVFLMEAMWSRFFPAIRKAREVLTSGELGAPKLIQADFGCVADPTNPRFWHPLMAGGAMLDIGIYLVQLTTMVFGPTMPDQMASTARLSDTGVDIEGSVSMVYKDRGMASLVTTLAANTPEQSLVICEKGHVRIFGPAHCPTQILVAFEEGRGKFREETHTFDLPACPEGFSMNYTNSEGLMYQVQEVEKCLQDGLLESPKYSHEESLVIVRIMDAYRKQVGVRYPFDV